MANHKIIIKNSILFFLLLTGFQIYAQQSVDIEETQTVDLSLEKEDRGKNHVVRISYTGNMGVLITHQNRTVIIDGFHKAYRPAYVFPPESMVRELINGGYKDYSFIDIALVTHQHRDHFDAAYLKDFLKKNPKSITVGAQQIKQAINAVLKTEDSEVLSRINTVKYDYKTHVVIHHNIKVKAFRCNHVNPSRHATIQNIAYIVKIGNYSIVHLGDTNWDVAEATLKSLKISDEGLDIAVIPYWMLLDKRSKIQVKNLIAPKQIIATHLPPDVSKAQKQKLHDLHPGIILFTNVGEEIRYK